MSTKKIPLVSVIIPMFNSAKFISQTLESLLYQTMKDFEVVVIDDCSTDNSVEVVESFSKRFGGRLQVVKFAKNTGTPGFPRNVGIQLARGKYIAFLDSDDLFTKTALEEFTTLAEKFHVDVVHLYSYYILWGGNARSVDDPAFTDMKELTDAKKFYRVFNRDERLNAPALESEKILDRINHWLELSAEYSTWLSFYRRDFLIKNQILFSDMETSEDAPFTFEAFCLAKTYLVAPNIVYIVRPRRGSAWRYQNEIPPEKAFHKDMIAFKDGFREFVRIMDRIPFFAEHPDYHYEILDWFANYRFETFKRYYLDNSPFVLSPFIEQELPPDNREFVSYLFNTANIYRLKIRQLQQELAKFQKQ